MKKSDIAFYKKDIEEAIEKKLCERSLYDFVVQSFKNVLEPSLEFKDNFHIKLLCDDAQKVIEKIARREDNEDPDFIINIPPRTMKSLMFSVCLNAWTWINFPELKFITCSHASSLSLRLADDTRLLIKSDWYQSKWGDRFIFSQTADAKGFFKNDKGGFRKATSVNGSVVGEGADVMIIDDLQDSAGAESKAERENAILWHDKVLMNRLNNESQGKRFYIMQRLHKKDIVGHILNKFGKESYKHYVLPMELTDEVSPPELKEFYQDGLFYPSRFPMSTLKKYKKDKRLYASQYLQNPVEDGGNIIKGHWIKEIPEIPKKYIRTIFSVDTAFEENETADYSVIMAIMETELHYIILSITRGQWRFSTLKTKLKALNQKYNPDTIVIEKKASGHSLIQELEDEKKYGQKVKSVTPSRDKTSRLYSVQPTFENGLVKVPREKSWFYEFHEELTGFPKADHDDQVDAVTMGLTFLKGTLKDSDLEPHVREL